MDILQIKGLSVLTRIGVYAWEQQILQRLLIDISIPSNFSACQDDIANTVDYDKLCHQVTTYVELNSFHLIETVAENVANLIKQEFNVPQLTISVSKPHAIKNASDIRVTVTR
ncbi:dihydroneopterin aldolase [Legionella brunensis]|uniref:7,8-dihydroneopterin aldolase n=1 Tax=Legionella brunensis TaxID=29422 RepID=A0A0W0S0N8_9GAMM|nr:dihydroneopterin aldolase [Legionella brunensis]KTC77079.1 dihydroneopterin aldolase [Legionella brunensis]